MTEKAREIFERVYQSYVTGGDTYTYVFRTKNTKDTEKIKQALDELSSEGLAEVISVSEKKANLVITDEGIAYGNSFI